MEMISSNESAPKGVAPEENATKRKQHFAKLFIGLAILVLLAVVVKLTLHGPKQEETQPDKGSGHLSSESTLPQVNPQAKEASSETERCAKLLPGLEKMSRGIDITSLDLFHSPHAEVTGYKNALFALTCSQGRTWVHPDLREHVYSQPDQVALINAEPIKEQQQTHQFHSSLRDVKESLSAKVGIAAKFVAGHFSASVAYTGAREKILYEDKSVVEVRLSEERVAL